MKCQKHNGIVLEGRKAKLYTQDKSNDAKPRKTKRQKLFSVGQSGFKKVWFPFVNVVKNLDLAEGKSEQLFVLDHQNLL